MLLISNQILLLLHPEFGLITNAFVLFLFTLLAVYDFSNVFIQDVLMIASVFPLLNFCAFLIPATLPILLKELFLTIILIFLSLYFLTILPIPHHYFKKKEIKLFDLVLIFIIAVVSAIDIPSIYHSQFTKDHAVWYALGIFTLFSSITEVVFFQGLLQNAIQLKSKKFFAVGMTTVLFILFHLTGNFAYIPIYLFVGLLVSSIYAISENIPIAIGLNIIINLIFLLLVHSPLWSATS